MKILCVHGIGHQEAKGEQWLESWENALVPAFVPTPLVVDGLSYDQLFSQSPVTGEYLKALRDLLVSWATHREIQPRADAAPRSRAMRGLGDTWTWTAGMVAHWVANDALREKLAKQFLAQVNTFQPDVIVAHSLGSLIAYDALARNPSVQVSRQLVTLGSQIGHPALRKVFGGRLTELERLSHWYHLYNPHDHAFTTSLSALLAKVDEVEAPFDLPNDPLNHDATAYLNESVAQFLIWDPIRKGSAPIRGLHQIDSVVTQVRRGRAVPPSRSTQRKALLVGINDYPAEKDRLAGCVNDVYLMSALLQECGFESDNIRVVVDSRATTQGILDRLCWLLDGTQEGEERVFFYSGHGAQIPANVAEGEPEGITECLCPWDFDWSLEHAFTDHQFRALYSQLPYRAHFAAIMDCCHSGGMTRAPGARVRGLTAPDDLRHRSIAWDATTQSWVPRIAEPANKEPTKATDKRLGHAGGLRANSSPKANAKLAEKYGHLGPYMPILLYACGKEELAAEYEHGSISYGAFTYGLDRELRMARDQGTNLTFGALLERVQKRLGRLGFAQVPSADGPKSELSLSIPWTHSQNKKQQSPQGSTGAKPSRKAKPTASSGKSERTSPSRKTKPTASSGKTERKAPSRRAKR